MAQERMLAHTPTSKILLDALGVALAMLMCGTFDTLIVSLADVRTFGGSINSNPLSGSMGALLACVALVAVGCTGVCRRRFGHGAAVVFAIVQALLLAGLIQDFSPTLTDACGFGLNAVSCTLLALWALTLAAEGGRYSLQTLAMALLAVTAIDVFAQSALVTGASVVIAFLAAVGSPTLLGRRSWHDTRQAPAPMGEKPSPRRWLVQASGGPSSLPFGIALLCIALYGFTMGRVQSMGGVFEANGLLGFLANHAVAIGMACTGATVVAVGHLRQPAGVLRVFVLVTLVSSLYFSGVFGTESGPVGLVAMTLARLSIFAYIWLLTCGHGGEGRWSLFAFGAGWGIFTLMNTCSTRLGLSVFADGAGYVVYNVLVIACLAGLIVIEFVHQVRKTQAQAQPTPTAMAVQQQTVPSASPDGEDRLLAGCRLLAQRSGLTARELDVLAPLVRGRSAASIAESLSMSVETARTHIRHIYQKTDIHGREELMDAVEALGGQTPAAGER